MDWIQSLNKAIAYMEQNLLTDLSPEDVAKQVHISNYHFQRAFHLLTGMTIGEYIRSRRLSLAGHELAASNSKVIDIALKYQYETPESFAKAFSRFHGITPSQARIQGAHLKSLNRLLIKITLEGGTVMDYRIESKKAFQALVKVQTFTPETSQKGIPAFWSDYFSSGMQHQVPGAIGICEQEKACDKEFNYGIGCIYTPGKNIPEGFKLLEIPAYTWVIFRCVGPMPGAIQDTWSRIYSEWLPQAEYQLLPDYDLEVYTEGDNQSSDYVSEIWIPVTKK